MPRIGRKKGLAKVAGRVGRPPKDRFERDVESLRQFRKLLSHMSPAARQYARKLA